MSNYVCDIDNVLQLARGVLDFPGKKQACRSNNLASNQRSHLEANSVKRSIMQRSLIVTQRKKYKGVGDQMVFSSRCCSEANT